MLCKLCLCFYFLTFYIGGKRKDRDRSRERGGDRDGRGRDDRDGRFPRRSGPQPADICYNCGEPGHW